MEHLLSTGHGAPSGSGWKEVLRVRRVAANILNKQLRTADKGWSSSLGVGRGAATSHRKNLLLLRNVSKRLRPGLILWCQLCCTGAKLGLSFWGRNID
jgi:hypothetical protein